MSGLYVPLDVEYDSDDKLILAGPMAELLYVRGLAFCKRTMSNGDITRAQLAVVGRGIPSAAKHASALVETGAWLDQGDRWHVAAWLKRNKSVAEIKQDKANKKVASEMGNHKRWHTGPDGHPKADCSLCFPNGNPTPDPTGDAKPDRKGREGKGEPEPEGSQREARGKPEGRESTNAAAETQVIPGDGRAAAALELWIEHRTNVVEPENPEGFAIDLRRNDAKPAECAAYLAANPTADHIDLAEHVYGMNELALFGLTGISTVQRRRSA